MHQHRPHASAARPAVPPLALSARVDPRVPICHSRHRIDFAFPDLRDTPCACDSSAFRASQPPRAAPGTLQIPNRLALNPAVQSNRFYPPCSRTADKILFVGPIGRENMRLWSLHPQYLDPRGLVALWREGLLAQAVLAGRTRGYRHHPQLARFLKSSTPRRHIAAYLRLVYAEATGRGYHFDIKKIGRGGAMEPLLVTRGQLKYEWAHLTHKLKARAPAWLGQLEGVKQPAPHPLFRVVAGGIADWEVVAAHPIVPAGVSAWRARR